MAITRAQQARQLYRSAGAVEAAYGKSAAKAGPVERGGGRDPMRQFDDPNTKAAAQRELARREEKIGLGDKTGLSKLPFLSTQLLNLIKVPRGNEFATQFNRSLRSLQPPPEMVDRGGPDQIPEWMKLGFNSEAEYLASLQAQEAMTMDQETLTPVQQALLERGNAIRFAAEGGIMDLDTGRQMYGLGKLVKKVTRGIKKIAKSPLGKAALIGGGLGLAGIGPFAGLRQTAFGTGLANFFGTGSFNPLKEAIPNVGKIASPFAQKLSKFGLTNVVTGDLTGKGVGAAITAVSLLPLLGIGTGDESEEEAEELLRGQGIDIAAIRANPNQYLARRFAAEGGIMRQQYQEGSKEPVAKKTMPLLDMGGMEKDYREDGGFVPIGRMEKADDVPARLSKNEFVFTADAVRNAGDGDIDKGAEVMYNMMKNLEAGGEVSEESQGLEGAREMFQTSRRLEEVL
jgi:hypothetical protein